MFNDDNAGPEVPNNNIATSLPNNQVIPKISIQLA